MQSGNIPSFPNGTILTVFDSSEVEQGTEANERSGQKQNPWGMMPDMGDFDINNIPEGGKQFPGGNMQNTQRPSGSNQSGSIGSVNNGFMLSDDMIMLGVSVAVLALGLLFAALFKRRK